MFRIKENAEEWIAKRFKSAKESKDKKEIDELLHEYPYYKDDVSPMSWREVLEINDDMINWILLKAFIAERGKMEKN